MSQRPRQPRKPARPRPGSARPARGAKPAGWDQVAAWYDKLVGDEGSDYHRNVILPAALRLLDLRPGERVLDLCCGQGVLARRLLELDAGFVLGVDASAKLIDAARSRGPREALQPDNDGQRRLQFAVRDARDLGPLADGSFDAAACIMAVQDTDGLDALCRSLSRALRVGGRAVLVMMHPCFRVPRQSSWEWDEAKRTQYRRIDRYATPMQVPIATHPGRDPGQKTLFHHRPLAAYLNALGEAGLPVVGCEELVSHRIATPGSHSRGENRAAAEIPVFLALKAVRTAMSSSEKGQSR